MWTQFVNQNTVMYLRYCWYYDYAFFFKYLSVKSYPICTALDELWSPQWSLSSHSRHSEFSLFWKNLKSLKESCSASPTLRACALESVEQILVLLLNIQVIFWGKLLNFMGCFCLKFCVNMLYPGSSKTVIMKEKKIVIL